jgi:FtsH-binding integral membrane protein
MENVWARTEAQSTGARISTQVYNLLIGAVLFWGFLVNWIMVKSIPYEAVAGINPMVLVIGYFASCFTGIYLYTKSKTPAISFIGYNLVVVPFGLIINLVVHHYDPGLVLAAIRVTGLVTLVMMALGSVVPAFFEAIGGALTIALLGVIVVEAVEIFIFHMHHDVIDWIVVVIFCGYIGYDWARANRIPKTVDNAVDCAASLYIDIINLFLRILRIMGRKR